jgi:hypothetical protein
MSDFGRKFYGISSNFTKFGKGFLKPSLYLPVRGAEWLALLSTAIGSNSRSFWESGRGLPCWP